MRMNVEKDSSRDTDIKLKSFDTFQYTFFKKLAHQMRMIAENYRF